GIPCDRLDADFAAQRIRKLSLFETVRNSFSSRSSTKHATLIDRFAYPLRGTGSVYHVMAARVPGAGGAIHLKSPVRQVTSLPDGGIELSIESGVHKHYDHVASSMPLTHLVRALPEVPAAVTAATGALRFRNTLLVYLQVESMQLFSDQWLYVHAPELEVG